jgi:hypothetical protein
MVYLALLHTKALHAIEVGLVLYMLEIFFDELSKKAKEKLDTLVLPLVKHPKQHGYTPFPFPHMLMPTSVLC